MRRAPRETLLAEDLQPGIRELVDLLENCNDSIHGHRLSWNLPSGDSLALEVGASSLLGRWAA
jgi:hypothetical protein